MLTLDGVPLDDPSGRFYVLAASRVRTPPAVVVNDVTVPGQHGVIPSNTSVYGPGSAVLTMRVRGGSYTALMANYTALMAAVGIRRVARTLVDTEIAQQASVQPVSISDLEQNVLRKMATCAVTFSIPRSFWRDTADITVDLGTTAGTKTPSALTGGSAPILDPLFVVAGGNFTNITITDDAAITYCNLTGNIPAGQSVRIEPDPGLAWLVPSGSPWGGGTDVSGFLTLGPGQFSLTSGSGFTITRVSPATNTQVRARRAYL